MKKTPPPPPLPPPTPPSSSSSPTKNQKPKVMQPATGFTSINEDLVHNVLKRLPAVSFASAACVSKSWNQICNRILSRPKFASAMSLHPSPPIAVEKVVEKVLSEPIRPQFAIANVVGHEFVQQMETTLKFLAAKLGSSTPIIVSSASGIMGTDVITDEFKEVMSVDAWSDGDEQEDVDVDSGIVLTVGFVPGLRVEAIPLLRYTKVTQLIAVDKFVMDVGNVSGCTSPVGIIMFGNGASDLRPIVEKLDYQMSKETIIVGDEKAQFLYRTGMDSSTPCKSNKDSSDAVALVFARDREKAHGIGEIQFHAAISNGVSAVGPRYKAASVRVSDSDNTTWLTARREGQLEILDGQRILSDINDELGNRIECPALFIGVEKRRKCFIGSEKPRLMTSLAFHGVIGGDEEYLFADGVGIRTGDCFQFYHSDAGTALSSCNDVSVKLRNFKLDWNTKKCPQNVGEREFLGGFIFSCCGRSESFFGRQNVDSSPFLENFPGLPSAGVFCGGEIGRGVPLNVYEGQDGVTAPCCLHVYSTVYLLVSYSPATLDN